MRIIISLFLILASIGIGRSQENQSALSLPPVFLIGEYEDQYNLLYEEYNQILLSVCKDNMYLAFDKWMDLLQQIETHADLVDVDIKGVKLWLKVFWSNDGSIDYISYFLKPTSRNINIAHLNAFFKSFIKHYQSNINANVKFTHHGSAQFPTSTMPGLSPQLSRKN